LAFAIVAGALETLFPQFDPFLIFLAAVSLSAFLAETAPAMLTAIIGLVFILLWPPGAVWLAGPHSAIALGTYVVIAIGQILLFHYFAEELATLRAANLAAVAELDRQTVRFQELQHRVGNHMQVIASILTLQKARVRSDPSLALAAFDETRERVVNMSRLHRRLYDPASAGKNVQEHLHDLCADFAASTQHKIICSVAPDASITDPLKLVSVSLLVGEAINNSLKHAFPEGEIGMIWVSLAPAGDLQILEVRDSGRGAAPGPDPRSESGLGLKIMQSLAGQLNGRFEAIHADGFTIRLAFRE
jgi:two-component sensor histidine kinase